MEKNGRIILIDKELSEGQQKLSRYIEHYTGIPFTGDKYVQWQTWVDLNKPYADHEKAKENASRDETTVRPHKPHDKKRGREIACDAEILYKAIKSIGETNQHVCALCGFGHSYLSDVKRRGWLYESDIEKLAQVNIDPGDYVTDAWYRAKHELDKVDPIPELTSDALPGPLMPLPHDEPGDLDRDFENVVRALKLTDDEVRAFRTKAAYSGLHPIMCIGSAVIQEAWEINEKLVEVFGMTEVEA